MSMRVGKLAVPSSTRSTPESRRAALSAVRSSTAGCSASAGSMRCSASAAACALGRTQLASSSVKKVWRGRFVSSTTSRSIRRSRPRSPGVPAAPAPPPTPARPSSSARWLPVAPRPTMATRARPSRSCPATPNCGSRSCRTWRRGAEAGCGAGAGGGSEGGRAMGRQTALAYADEPARERLVLEGAGHVAEEAVAVLVVPGGAAHAGHALGEPRVEALHEQLAHGLGHHAGEGDGCAPAVATDLELDAHRRAVGEVAAVAALALRLAHRADGREREVVREQVAVAGAAAVAVHAHEQLLARERRHERVDQTARREEERPGLRAA